MKRQFKIIKNEMLSLLDEMEDQVKEIPIERMISQQSWVDFANWLSKYTVAAKKSINEPLERHGKGYYFDKGYNAAFRDINEYLKSKAMIT